VRTQGSQRFSERSDNSSGFNGVDGLFRFPRRRLAQRGLAVIRRAGVSSARRRHLRRHLSEASRECLIRDTDEEAGGLCAGLFIRCVQPRPNFTTRRAPPSCRSAAAGELLEGQEEGQIAAKAAPSVELQVEVGRLTRAEGGYPPGRKKTCRANQMAR
jgi:hypothetical protein